MRIVLQGRPEGLVGGVRVTQPVEKILRLFVVHGEFDEMSRESPVLTAFEWIHDQADA
jgi:hypothetical protein